MIPISQEVLDDSAGIRDEVNAGMRDALDLAFNPWKRPHVNPFPALVPFPRVERARQLWALIRERADLALHGCDCEDW